MIGLDTNVLVRALVDDGTENGQAAAARKVLSSQTAFISLVTLAETIWVLLRTYNRPRHEVAAVTKALADNPRVVLQSRQAVVAALGDHDTYGGDLNDHIIARLGQAAGCATSLTFDKKASQSECFTRLTF